jgi:4-aminobutyrate aminotransferase and related aminotransferases
VFGKALANGLPISVVGGKAKLMDSDYFVSTTFAGDTTAITAAMLTLQTAKAKVPAIVDQAERFQKSF